MKMASSGLKLLGSFTSPQSQLRVFHEWRCGDALGLASILENAKKICHYAMVFFPIAKQYINYIITWIYQHRISFYYFYLYFYFYYTYTSVFWYREDGDRRHRFPQARALARELRDRKAEAEASWRLTHTRRAPKKGA